MTTDKAFRGFGYALGAYLNHPDYYKGRWAVSLHWGGKVYWKKCSNYTTARAWADYITRKHGASRTGLRKLDPVPGFPMPLDEAINQSTQGGAK